jgi:uncharacterized protein YciI
VTEETTASDRARVKDVPRDIQPYCIGLLRKGKRWNDTQGAEADDLLGRHLAFLREQVEAGRYVVAGPIIDDESLAGVIIISAKTVQQAMAIAAEDPAVKTGRLAVEVHSVFLPSFQGFKVRF